MKQMVFGFVLLLSFLGPGSSFGGTEKAVFAGGCFWCMESPLEKLNGVQSVVSGYIGGKKKDPTYEEVSQGNSGHIEAVEVVFDNTKVSYKDLLKVFWKNIDPLDPNGQFCDKGEQYTSGIFTQNDVQRRLAQESLAGLQSEKRFKGKKIATFIRDSAVFYKAEEYHQDYYKKNPVRYNFYRFNCGRDKRLKEIWE